MTTYSKALETDRLLTKFGSILLFIFILMFPKGGIKLQTIPITWGYLFLGSFAFFSLFQTQKEFVKTRLFALFSLLPFQCIVIATLILYGCEHLGYTISLIISIFLLPIAFYCLFSSKLENLPIEFLTKWLKETIFFIAIYGIVLFFIKLTTGKFIEIPLLTVNWHDLGSLETTKNIDRGGIFKLISTYNNGNLFGISVLILLPFYQLVEKVQVKRLVVKLALLLTLSRTVWYGLIFAEIMSLLLVDRITWKTWIKIPLVVMIYSFLINKINLILTYGNEFLFDTSLGGRDAQFTTFKKISFFAKKPFQQIDEIVPLSILDSFGLLGLLSYFLGFTMPIILNFNKRNKSSLSQSLCAGLLTYQFVSMSDGAFLLIPTLAIYFFAASFSLCQRETAF